MRINLSIKSALILICVVYTLLTLTSSIYSLAVGRATDTHIHLLLRFLITAIGIGSILIFNLLPKWHPAGIFALHYGVTIGLILLAVILSGYFIELHPNAYRDILLNFTPVYILIAAGLIISGKFKNKVSKLN